jgi:hypothetical protein
LSFFVAQLTSLNASHDYYHHKHQSHNGTATIIEQDAELVPPIQNVRKAAGIAIRKQEMGGECGTYWEKRNAYLILTSIY